MKNIISIKTKATLAKSVSIICGVLAFILFFGVVGQADYCAEIGSVTPGILNYKWLAASVVMMLFSYFSMRIFNNLDTDSLFDLSLIPVYIKHDISDKAENNAFFDRQIDRCLDMFYNGEYGVLSAGDVARNIKAMNNGNGVVIGQYSTTYGSIVVTTNSKRTRTDIMYAKEYNRHGR